MGNVLLLSPTPIAAIAASRGSGVANLLTRPPKEVWADVAAGSVANIDVDFGAVVPVDTVYLGYLYPPAAGATWTITGGAAGYTDVTLSPAGALRAVDSASRTPKRTHAFWHGDVFNVRYLRLAVTQAAGSPALTAGVVMAGKAWQPQFNMEFGSGRRVIDTGTVASLPDGGFATMEGARKRAWSWTLGDLSVAETDALEELQLDHGETIPLLVVEDPDATAGQRNRLHYGLFTGLKAYEREDPTKTKWSFDFEEWA
ncbi:hypothetical protein [Novosphingobium sp. EMRT-2]|uniref:hypothetical protein n=1 Tax=Novosphingobium sp. EMRT-2 TaxID=2571749 RepID=UPI0010BD5830|nr:hypothetical protein [Novosphingobium sp. EMRT-2]QCI93275.1 hypothetical protein FA702_06705 [Novosphingobium sp. EMRT-2]